jgi:hypothetical protein
MVEIADSYWEVGGGFYTGFESGGVKLMKTRGLAKEQEGICPDCKKEECQCRRIRDIEHATWKIGALEQLLIAARSGLGA